MPAKINKEKLNYIQSSTSEFSREVSNRHQISGSKNPTKQVNIFSVEIPFPSQVFGNNLLSQRLTTPTPSPLSALQFTI
jgi:hypothetical protein